MNSSYYTQISTLLDIVYQTPGIGSFPLFRNLPVQAGFSWGKESPNMSYKVGDKASVEKAHQTFFTQLNLPKHAILIDPSIQQAQQILEVQAALFASQENEIITGANVLFTTDPTIALMVHPGDCPCAVIYAKRKENKPLLGLAHFGRKQTDGQLPKKAVMYLKSLGIAPKDIFIGICPGIAAKNYFVTQDNLPHIEQWGKYSTPFSKDGKSGFLLDLQGYIVQQLFACGILPKQTQLYTVDTFAAAQKGEGFSHRFAMENRKPEKDGRFLFAASLKTA